MRRNTQEIWPRIRKRKTKVKGHNYSYLAYQKLNGRATLLDAVETFLQHLPQDGAK